MEAVIDFLFLGSKMTVDSDCSHKTKRRLLLGRKVMTKVDSLIKSRDITLPTKIHTVKSIVLTIQVFVDRVISLLFNSLSRFVIAFLPRKNYLLIS